MQNIFKFKVRSKNCFILFLKGFCIGVANAIPGVSGGTVAFLLGIYEDLINSIKSFNIIFLKNIFKFRFKEAFSSVAWKFLGTIILGAATSIICFAQLIKWLLLHKPILVNSFFFGLILATIPIIARIIQKWNIKYFFLIIVSSILSWMIIKGVPLDTPESLLFIFICGVLAISSMILPGLSGAFILVLLGKYSYILNCISNKDFVILGTFMLGIIIGILFFVRILSWLFRQYHDSTISVLTGLIIGSLNKIWPWKKTFQFIETKSGELIPLKQMNVLPGDLNVEVWFALFLMIIGFILACFLNKSPNKKIL